MKILLFGGTSFFGLEILRSLCRWDYDVTFVTRGNNKPPNIDAKHIQGDCRDPATLQKAQELGPWDLLIDNIAFGASDVHSALALRPKHYFLTSSIGVYDGIGPIREDRPDTTSPYAIKKRLAEWAVLSQNEIAWTIFRPAIVYGPADPMERWRWYVEYLLTTRKILFIEESPARLSFVYSEDIAQAYLSAVKRLSRVSGKIIDLGQDEKITAKDYVMDHAAFFGVSKAIEVFNQIGPYSYDRDFVIRDNTLAKELLNWKPTPWLEAIRLTAPWFKSKLEGKNHEGPQSHS